MEKESRLARFSAIFSKRFRLTILVFLSVGVLGLIAYLFLLKTEGFPSVGIPYVFVEGSYFVDDADKVNQELTAPIEKAATSIDQVKEVTSTTFPTGNFISVEFEDSVKAEDALEKLEKIVTTSVTLPDDAKISYRIINAGAIDGESDLIFNLSGKQDITKLQDKATEIADKIAGLPEAASAKAISLFKEQINPITGESFSYQSGFNRVGYRDENNALIFEPAISVGVMRNAKYDLVDLSKAVKGEIQKLEEAGKLDNLTITYGGDQSGGVLEQKSSLESNALFGFISVFIVIFLLIEWRASIIGGIFIPLVLTGVFIAFYAIGYSINVISLYSLVLVLGIFVDNAIVIIDAIERAKDNGYRGIQAVKKAIKEVGLSMIAGTWTTILVFIPMLFITGILGDFIILIPITVIIALLISLFFALTFTPWLSNILIRDKHETEQRGSASRIMHRILGASNRFVKWVQSRVKDFVHTYLQKTWKIASVIVIVIGLIGGGLYFSTRLDFTIFPAPKDTDQLIATLQFPSGTNVKAAEEKAEIFESDLKEELGNDLVGVTYYLSGEQSATLIIDLTDVNARERTSVDMINKLQERTKNYQDVKIKVAALNVGPPTDDYPVVVRVESDDEKILAKGTEDVKSYLTDRALTEGQKVTEVVIDRFDILTKVDGQRFAQVKAKISDSSKTNVILALKKDIESDYNKEKLEQLGLAEGAIVLDLGMEGMNIASFESAAVALIIALVVMYGLLVMQFNSFVQPLLIIIAIPFSFPLLFPALFISNNAMSFFVMLGMITLSGIVVNNTILLIQQANTFRKEGLSAREAISQAVGIRFRAVMTTSLTTIAGLIPLSLSEPFWEPLTFTIIFGLASSVILVITAFPAFYVVIEDILDFFKKKLAKKNIAPTN